MFSFIQALFNRGEKQPYTGTITPAKIGAEDAPGYPPPPNGIPLLAPERLLDKHADLLATLRQTVGIADPLFDKLYLPSIQRMASFVHLLPASESHHHRGAGGALRHAIEVATYTARASESVMIGSLDLPVRRKQKEVAWRYAAFVAGLCHDIGKPITDLTANTDDGQQWNPMAESLYEWGAKTGAPYYYIAWQPNRHKMHEQFYSMLVSKITGHEGMEYLGDVGHEAVGWVLSLNQAATIDQKKMYELVTKGDMLSVENDLRTHAGGAEVAVAGVNLEKVVQDTLQNRFRLEIWPVNKLGGRAWKTTSGVFLVWPISGGEIIEDLSAMRALGLPRTPDALLSFMIERGLAVRMANDDNSESAIWKLKIPANNELTATVSAIKLSDDSGIPSMLVGVPALPDVEPEQPPEAGKPQEASSAQVPATSPAVQGATSASANQETKPELQPQAEAQNPKAQTKPSTESRQSSGSAPRVKQPLVDMGPHGIILDSLRSEMTSGRKKHGEDYVRLNDGRLAIAYPEGLKGAGVDPITILEWLEENEMLETDPYQHDKKTHEIDGFTPPKRSRKSILLTREASQHFELSNSKASAAPPVKQEARQVEQAVAPALAEQKAPNTIGKSESGDGAKAPRAEDLPSILLSFVNEIKQAKVVGNTPFMIEDQPEGFYVPRHTTVSWFLKRCEDKSARNDIASHIETNNAIKQVERSGKRMLFIPRSML